MLVWRRQWRLTGKDDGQTTTHEQADSVRDYVGRSCGWVGGVWLC